MPTCLFEGYSCPSYIKHLVQIGSTWVVTAAHCLFEDEDIIDVKSLSILLGLHDRSKKSEPNRCFTYIGLSRANINEFLTGGK